MIFWKFHHKNMQVNAIVVVPSQVYTFPLHFVINYVILTNKIVPRVSLGVAKCILHRNYKVSAKEYRKLCRFF